MHTSPAVNTEKEKFALMIALMMFAVLGLVSSRVAKEALSRLHLESVYDNRNLIGRGTILEESDIVFSISPHVLL
jgi:hypothetical protein